MIAQVHTRTTPIETTRTSFLAKYLEPAYRLASELGDPYKRAVEAARHHILYLPYARLLALRASKDMEAVLPTTVTAKWDKPGVKLTGTGRHLQIVRGLVRELDQAINSILSDRYTLDRLRARVHLLFVAAFFEPTERSNRFGFLSILKPRVEEGQRLASEFLGAYTDMLILEERIQGNLSAFEGIRLVKERKKTSGPIEAPVPRWPGHPSRKRAQKDFVKANG